MSERNSVSDEEKNRKIADIKKQVEEREEELEDLEQAEIENLEVINDGLRASHLVVFVQINVDRTVTLYEEER